MFGSHPEDPGSNPGNGTFRLLLCDFKTILLYQMCVLCDFKTILLYQMCVLYTICRMRLMLHHNKIQY